MSFVKLITESFNTKPNINNNLIKEDKLSLHDLDKLIVENTNKLLNIKSKYEDIKSTWASLKEDLQTFSFYNHITENTNESIKEQFQKAIDNLKMDYRDTQATLNAYKEQKNKLLLEEKEDTSIIDNNDNDKTDVEEVESNSLEVKYRPIFEKLQSMVNTSDIYTVFEFLYNSLVPRIGKAETKAGEILRALMAIVYEAFESDGAIVFYEGIGKNKLRKEISFLKSNNYNEYLNSMIGLNGEDYLDEIDILIEKIMRDFLETPELMWEENKEDYTALPVISENLKENSNIVVDGDLKTEIEIPTNVRKALRDEIIDNDTLYREFSEWETPFGMIDDIVDNIRIDREFIYIEGINEDVKDFLHNNAFEFLLEILDNHINNED